MLGATEAMRAHAGDGTVVLGVDDAQLLDDASAALVLNLATSAGVFVLVTVRSDVRAPDAIDSLWKDSGARRIDLTPMSAGGLPEPIAAQLRELAARCDCRLIDARAGHAAALAGGDGKALVTAGERLEAIGATAAAVDALVAAARLFLAEGRQDSARRAAGRAMELHPTGQGTDFPTIDGLDGIAVELSPREAQIAALVARGLTNHEIAEQLVLSVRTVETYVYRAMQKRGVESRHEL